MAGSRSSCGNARHLGHMVALRRKRKQQLCVDYSKPPMLSCGSKISHGGQPIRAALIRGGPWGYIHARRPEAEVADLQLNSVASWPRP
jgi:hypothetical protein